MTNFAPYLFAHFAKSQLWHASTLLFAFFLTERCGLRPVEAGWILGVSLVANGVADLVVGRCWKNSGASIAAASRMQAVFAPISAVFFVLFCATAFLPAAMRLGWALAMILGFRFSYPLVDVPQNTLVPLLFGSRHGQRRLLACRNIVSQAANLAVSVAAVSLLTGQLHDAGYLWWAATIGGLACVTSLRLARAGLRAEAPSADEPRPAPPVPGYAILLVILAIMVAAGATFRVMEPYLEAFAFAGRGFLLWAALGALLSQPLWLALVDRLGVPRTMGIVASLLMLSALLLLGPARDGPVGVAFIALGYGIGSGSLWLTLWSCMAIHASRDDAMWRVSGFTCISKVSQGGATVFVGHLLQQSSYRATLSDPLSMASLLMPLALVAIAACCIALAIVLARERFGRQTPNGRHAALRASAGQR